MQASVPIVMYYKPCSPATTHGNTQMRYRALLHFCAIPGGGVQPEISGLVDHAPMLAATSADPL